MILLMINCTVERRCQVLEQGFTKLGSQVNVATKCLSLAHNISGALVWNLLHVTVLAPRVLSWLLDLWKFCVPLF